MRRGDKGVPGCNLFRKRSDQGNRPVKVFVAAPPQIVLRLRLFAVGESQLSKVVVDFPQPTCVRRLVGIFYTPGQLGFGCLPLMEEAWKLGVDDARDPVHNENLPSGKLLGLFQYRDRFFDVADSTAATRPKRRVERAAIRWRSDTAPFERPSGEVRIPSAARRKTPHPRPADSRSNTAP